MRKTPATRRAAAFCTHCSGHVVDWLSVVAKPVQHYSNRASSSIMINNLIKLLQLVGSDVLLYRAFMLSFLKSSLCITILERQDDEHKSSATAFQCASVVLIPFQDVYFFLQIVCSKL